MKYLIRKLLSLRHSKKYAPYFFSKAGKPLHAGFVLHSEAVQDNAVYERLKELGTWLTFRPALCVMTPRNPYIKDDMEKRGLTEDGFGQRLRELARYYDIGLHGHWCKKVVAAAPFNRNVPTRIEKAGFTLTMNEPAMIERQFNDECAYLAEQGFTPRIYSAGWWFLDPTVVGLLDSHGFTLDCSARYGYPDSFGGRYLSTSDLHNPGRPFFLKPSARVAECPGIFYLHANWWTLARELLPLLKVPDGPLFVTVPLHDYDLVGHSEKVKDNVGFIASIKNVSWMNMGDLASAAASSLAEGGAR